MRRVIRLGDKTTHGGEVVSAADNYSIMGKAVARIGDMATCPRKGHGTCEIVEGDPTWTINGRNVALEGHKLKCGAELISSLGNLLRSYEGDGVTAQQNAAIGQANPAISKEIGNVKEHGYDLFFHIKNVKTGASQPQTRYRIILDDGREFVGVSDQNGFTEKVFADIPQNAKIEAPYYDSKPSNTNAVHGSDTCGC